jgi:hypothetical protein
LKPFLVVTLSILFLGCSSQESNFCSFCAASAEEQPAYMTVRVNDMSMAIRDFAQAIDHKVNSDSEDAIALVRVYDYDRKMWVFRSALVSSMDIRNNANIIMIR